MIFNFALYKSMVVLLCCGFFLCWLIKEDPLTLDHEDDSPPNDPAKDLALGGPLFSPSQKVTHNALKRASDKAPSEDRLAQIRGAAVRAADLELEIGELEDRLADLRSRLHRALSEEIPTLMTEAGCLSFTLKGGGNLPNKVFKVEPYYQASVPAGWPEERRQRAFSALREHQGGWLIKTTVMARFPQHEDQRAREFVQAAQAAGVEVEVKQAVHQAQATKWLKERHQAQRSLPDLELISGAVGQRAVIKDA